MPCFIWVRDLGHFVCIVVKINNILLCVKRNHVNMCLRDVLHGNCDQWKLHVGNNYPEFINVHVSRHSMK